MKIFIQMLFIFLLSFGWVNVSLSEEDNVSADKKVAHTHDEHEKQEIKIKVIKDGDDGQVKFKIRTDDFTGDIELPEKAAEVLEKIITKLPQDKFPISKEDRQKLKDSLHKGVEIKFKGHHSHKNGRSDDSFMEQLVPILGIIFSLGMPVIITAVVLYARHRKRKLHKELIEKIIDSEQELTPELLVMLGNEKATESSKSRTGLILLALGISLFIYLSVAFSVEKGTIGLIPAFIGLAYLLSWKLDKDNDSSSGLNQQ